MTGLQKETDCQYKATDVKIYVDISQVFKVCSVTETSLLCSLISLNFSSRFLAYRSQSFIDTDS